MPLVVRLHPEQPVSASDFAGYLTGLEITAIDLSFDQTKPPTDGSRTLGTARSDPNPTVNRILQHVTVSGLPPIPVPKSVATAVIDVTQTWPEFASPDVELQVTRAGRRVAVYRVDFNATVVASLPSMADYASSPNVSIFIPLPGPGREIDPTDAIVELPANGTPPRFDDLMGAVRTVLAGDPGITNTASVLAAIRALTPAQIRHIAREIAWNRRLEPVPPPPRSLEDMYTAPTDDDANRDRQTFESNIIRYDALHGAQAERLFKYITAMSLALICEQKSVDAARVGFHFPIRPNSAPVAGKVAEGEVILEN